MNDDHIVLLFGLVFFIVIVLLAVSSIEPLHTASFVNDTARIDIPGVQVSRSASIQSDNDTITGKAMDRLQAIDYVFIFVWFCAGIFILALAFRVIVDAVAILKGLLKKRSRKRRRRK